MANDPKQDSNPDFKELVHIVRDLTSRVERLERRLDHQRGDTSVGGDSRNTGHERSAVPAVSQNSAAPAASVNSALESRIGSQWLNRIGVVAVLFGVAYLLRYVFVNDWISAAAWIWAGVCAGIVIIAGSEWFRQRRYRVLSLSLKATGSGVSYLSLWAGLELYKVLSGGQTFSGLVLLTVLNVALALRESAQVLAALALVGGFLTPLLISIPSREVPLFLYIALLDCATATLAVKRDWWKLLSLSFFGTVLLCSIWYFEHYRRAELAPAIAAATVYFVIFCAAAMWVRGRLPAVRAPLLTALEMANPASYFGGLYLLLRDASHDAAAIPALALSVFYFALAWKGKGSVDLRANKLVAVYGGLGIAFVALALAILLQAGWLSLGWFVEAAAAMAIGFWQDLPWLRWGALLLLCAAVVKAFAYDVWQLGLGYRTLSFIGLGVLLLVISFAYQRYGFSTTVRSERSSRGPIS